MKSSGLLYFLIWAMLLTACKVLQKPGTSSSTGYSENITDLRPEYDDKLPVPQQQDTTAKNDDSQVEHFPDEDVTEKLDELLSDIIKKNEELGYTSGYTIQVYSGASKENADMVKLEIYKKLPTSRPKVEWVAPNYKVRVGIFLEKIEAQKSYSEIKKYFPQAVLIPTRIPNTYPISKY